MLRTFRSYTLLQNRSAFGFIWIDRPFYNLWFSILLYDQLCLRLITSRSRINVSQTQSENGVRHLDFSHLSTQVLEVYLLDETKVLNH
jgi:hypothetical protein